DRTPEFLEYPIVNDGVRWMEQSRKSNAFIGRPIERLEDLRLLRGRGQYVGDLAATNVLHAMVLRSNIAHGLIRPIDASRARAPASGPPGTVSSLAKILRELSPRSLSSRRGRTGRHS